MFMLSHIQLFVIPWTVANQAPLAMEFSRQEYWNALSFPTPGDLPDPELETAFFCISCIGRWVLCHRATWEALRHSLCKITIV